MTLRDFISSLFTRAANFLTYTVPIWQQGIPLPSRYNTQQFISEAFEGNPLCFAATMEIASSMAEAPLRVKNKQSGTPVSDANPLSRLLENPNDLQSMNELIIQTTAELLITGNSYWVFDNAEFPSFIQCLPSHSDQVRPFLKNGRLFYEFLNWGNKSITYPSEQILHFREAPDFQDPILRGMSPLVPIRRFIQIDNILARYIDDFFHNHAVPPALLIFKNKLNTAEMQRVLSEMKEQHATPGKYHSLGISFGDARLERMGISIKDLDIKPVLDFVETRILQAFNVPPILIGAAAAFGVS